MLFPIHVYAASFRLVPLGTSGGEFQDNLSAYLVSTTHSKTWVALDAGTTCSAIAKLPLSQLKRMGYTQPEQTTAAMDLFNQGIEAYLISHAHLDHIAGLIICSPIEKPKTIYGLNQTLNNIRDYLFNNQIWVNFTDKGEGALKKYHLHTVINQQNFQITDTPLQLPLLT